MYSRQIPTWYASSHSVVDDFESISRRLPLLRVIPSRFPLYDWIMGFYERWSNGRLLDMAPFATSERILEIGTGTGFLLGEILRRTGEGIPVVCGDSERLPFADHTLCAVVCLGAWRHFGRPEAVLREISRVLIPGGDLIIGYFPPKPAAFVTLPDNIPGRLLGRLYALITRGLGYVDRIDAEHEEITLRILRDRFAETDIVPSGRNSHLLHARAREGYR